MATGSLLLPLAGAYFPDGSANNLFAEPIKVKSSASAPAPHFVHLLMDAGAEEAAMWAFRMPVDFASGLTAKLQYKMASATSGDIILGVQVAAVSDADAQDIDAKGFAAANTGTQTVPGTAGHMNEVSITVTNADSVAAGDFVIVRIYRDGDAAGDTATGDLELIAATLEYTTT